jgi:hypothetical protein
LSHAKWPKDNHECAPTQTGSVICHTLEAVGIECRVSRSPPAMFDLGNSEATGTSRQFGLALIVCFLICEWQGLIGRG